MKKSSHRLLEVCTSIPPIKPRNLLPVLIMLGCWIVLRYQSVTEDIAFVVSVVTAQTYLVWRNLPQAAANLHKLSAPKARLLIGVVGLTLAIALLQIWLASPLFTQRVLSVLCAFFFVIMVIGMMNERELIDRLGPTMPLNGNHTPPISLLKVNATMAALIIAVNEWLIFFESPGVWITIMPLFMLVLHGLYWAMVLWTLPSGTEKMGQKA